MELFLYDLQEPALILPLPTGVSYTQQTGGLYCGQRQTVGALLPVPEIFLTAALMTAASDDNLITHQDANEIDKAWAEIGGDINMLIDRTRLEDSEEAWVYVTISMEQYAGTAILTWENSD